MQGRFFLKHREIIFVNFFDDFYVSLLEKYPLSLRRKAKADRLFLKLIRCFLGSSKASRHNSGEKEKRGGNSTSCIREWEEKSTVVINYVYGWSSVQNLCKCNTQGKS